MYEIESILLSILGSCDVKNKERIFYCPFCHHRKKKLSVNLEKHKWKCWTCDSKGNTLLSLLRKLDVPREIISKLAHLLQDELPTIKTNDESHVQLTLPPEFVPLYESSSSSFDFDNATEYLRKRGIGKIETLRYQIGYCQSGRYANRIIIPSYDECGTLNFFVARDFYNRSTLPYVLPPISRNVVGFEFFINWKLPIFLTEGVFDAMAVRRNSVPLFGKTLSRKLREKIIQNSVTEVYLLLDNDALKDTVRMAEKFMNEGITVYVVDLPQKDPSQLGFDKTHDLITSAKPLTFGKLIELKMRL